MTDCAEHCMIAAACSFGGDPTLLYLSMIESDEDRSKLEIIYQEYKNLMLHVANGILGDQRDSEDVVQQAFLKLIKIIHKIEEPKCHKTRALVVTIVERTAIDLYRRRQRSSLLPFDEEAVSVPAASELEGLQTRLDLAAAMAALPARQRQVLLLRYDDGFSCREIAGLLSMTEPNVRKTIQRAKERLAELLEEGGEKR